MIKTDIVYDHRGRTKPGAEGPLEVRICIARKRYYIGTGVHVRKSEWKCGSIVNRPNSDALNKRLSIIYQKIEDEVNLAIEEGREIDVADIRRRAWVTTADASSTSFLEWCDDQVDLLQPKLKPGTVSHYRTLLIRLREFDTIRRWSDLTTENIYAFDSWLHQQTKPQSDAQKKMKMPPEPLSDSGIYNYHKCLKSLLNNAVIFGRIEVNPYVKLKGRFKRGDKETVDYLSDEEMAAIEAVHPLAGSRMAICRDLFLFQMYTGMGYSDSQAFNIKNYKNVKGVWQFVGTRIKTGSAYVSQLLPPVVEILERYNWQVPKMKNAEYNQLLKLLGEVAGIEQRLHSHMGRHTFATWMQHNGVPTDRVQKMLGHKSITQTQRYAKVIACDVYDEFDKMADKLKKKTTGDD